MFINHKVTKQSKAQQLQYQIDRYIQAENAILDKQHPLLVTACLYPLAVPVPVPADPDDSSKRRILNQDLGRVAPALPVAAESSLIEPSSSPY